MWGRFFSSSPATKKKGDRCAKEGHPVILDATGELLSGGLVPGADDLGYAN